MLMTDNVCVKLRLRGNGTKYRMIASTEDNVFGEVNDLVESEIDYIPNLLLGWGEWFCIKDASTQDYAIDLLLNEYDSTDFESFDISEFRQIAYLFVMHGDIIFFQNVSPKKLVPKRCLRSFGTQFEFSSTQKEVEVHAIPDAIYDRNTDKLYFKKLESLTKIFKGADNLYRAATDEETKLFLQSSFITLRDGYSVTSVKKPNRKGIFQASKILSILDGDQKIKIFDYIGEYCPDLRAGNCIFAIGNERDLKMLLDGIQKRYYRDILTNEPQIAEASRPLSRGNTP